MYCLITVHKVPYTSFHYYSVPVTQLNLHPFRFNPIFPAILNDIALTSLNQNYWHW